MPSIDDDMVICGAPMTRSAHDNPSSRRVHAEADAILTKWYDYSVQWVLVAVQQAEDDGLTAEDFTRLILVRRNGKVCWRVQGLCKLVDVCWWFRETGAALFPSVAALASAWLDRSASNALQERVFSTGVFVMNCRRTVPKRNEQGCRSS